MEKVNMIGNTIKVVGWIVFSSGLITGFVIAGSETFLIAMLVWAAAVIIGALLLGVSEVIRLLQMLVDQAK